MIEFKAVGGYIIIEEIPEPVRRTSGGLELNEKVREDIRYRKATVVSPGDAIDSVKRDDLIMYDKAGGHTIDIGEETFTVITLRDVVAIL